MSLLRASLGTLFFVVAATVAWTAGRAIGQSAKGSVSATGVPMQTPAMRDARGGWQRIVDGSASSAHGAVSRSVSSNQTLPNLPAGPFGANLDELKRRAGESDAGAAKALADGYRRCEFYVPPKDQADLEKRVENDTVTQLNLVDQIVDQVNEKARQRGEAIRVPEQASLPAYQSQMKHEEQMAETCHGVDTADAKKWTDWYARAAELGDIEAELGYWYMAFGRADALPLDVIQHDKIAAANYLQDALSRGDWRALAAISAIFEAGYYADPDPFLAHAYAFAASQSASGDITLLPWMSGGFLMRVAAGNDTQTYLQWDLQRTATRLDAQQIAQSEQMGASLYFSCCAGGHR